MEVNSVPSVKIDAPLIAEPTGIASGSEIYMVPGTKATLTNYITEGSTFVVPVVQDDFSKMTGVLSSGGRRLKSMR